VRGTSEKDTPTILQMGHILLKGTPIEGKNNTPELVIQTNPFNTLNDYYESQKRILKGQSNELLIPGRKRIEYRTFKLTDLDLPYKTKKEYDDRKKSINTSDYGELAVKEGFEIAQKLRLKNYEKNHKKY
jgi:hypothetical protein